MEKIGELFFESSFKLITPNIRCFRQLFFEKKSLIFYPKKVKAVCCCFISEQFLSNDSAQ